MLKTIFVYRKPNMDVLAAALFDHVCLVFGCAVFAEPDLGGRFVISGCL
jgi:hypothetical protein